MSLSFGVNLWNGKMREYEFMSLVWKWIWYEFGLRWENMGLWYGVWYWFGKKRGWEIECRLWVCEYEFVILVWYKEWEIEDQLLYTTWWDNKSTKSVTHYKPTHWYTDTLIQKTSQSPWHYKPSPGNLLLKTHWYSTRHYKPSPVIPKDTLIH